MSKRQLKSQANSARAATAAFGAGFGASSPAVFGASSSQLAYVSEPPDLSAISDPNVVVYFRNLSKRDSTTKGKALEELQAYVSSLQSPVEEGVVEAFVKMYPRTAIDNAKSVRQNAHLLMGTIAASAGKTIAKHMPQVVAAWLSGLYDPDRAVQQDTINSLRKVFTSDEKIKSIRVAYQKPILKYCRDAIEQESALTLSDERTVSPDDAAAKYSRVIAACLLLVGSLLGNLKSEELSKYQSDYDTLLGDKKTWEFASHGDASIRRSAHRLLQTCVDKQPVYIEPHLETISKTFLAGALNSDQMSSSADYIEALYSVTTKYPTVWTTHYTSKTGVDRRLRQFLKKGSQHGPSRFWDRLVDLFKVLPKEVLPKDGVAAKDLLSALLGGVSGREELGNREKACASYLQIADLISQGLLDNEQPTLLQELVLPFVSQHLAPKKPSILPGWEVVASDAAVKAITVTGMTAVVQEAWPQYAKSLVDDIKTSAPEQSQEYKRSQDLLIQRARNLAKVQRDVLKHENLASLQSTFAEACASIVTGAMGVAKNRNGKPYGAAGVISEMLAMNGSLIRGNPEVMQSFEEFIQKDIPELILSPSSTHLVNILYLLADTEAFKTAWDSTMKAALAAEDSPAKAAAVDAILTSPKAPSSLDGIVVGPELSQYLVSRIESVLQGTAEWESVSQLVQSRSRVLPSSAKDDILSSMTRSLSLSDQAPAALNGLRLIVKQNPSLIRSFISSPGGSSLLPSLLLLSELPDEQLSQDAEAVSASIQTLMTAESSSKQTVFDMIHRELETASHISVTVDTLVDLAKQLVEMAKKSDTTSGPVAEVFPNLEKWDEALEPFLNTPPRPSMSITSSLNGAVYLVQSGGAQSRNENLPRDADGYSSAYRTAQYTVKLLEDDLFMVDKLPVEVQRHILDNVYLTAVLASDNLGLAGANNLWAIYNTAVESEALSFVSDAHNVTLDLRESLEESAGVNPISNWITELSSKEGADTSAKAFHLSLARSQSILAWLVSCPGGYGDHRSHDRKALPTAEIEELVKSLRKRKDNIALVAVLNAFKDALWAGKSCVRMCNELVADLTGVKIANSPEQTLRQLILLNALLYGQPEIVETIAKQRIIFFVKHVVPWLDGEVPLAVRAETCRALTTLLPAMQDTYGEHWEETLTALAKSWQNTGNLDGNETGTESPIAYTHASLKLYAQLRDLTTMEDPNDDLLDVWKSTEKEVAQGLINLLSHSQHFPDDFHQPLKIVNGLLGRQLAKVDMKHFESTEELFALLYVESQPVQQTAFDILHKKIPEAQEQISIDAAIEKTTARLPEELLSLILESPTMDALDDASFDRSMPLPLRGYLLSWLLVFDHLEHASFKVKNDYIDQIKEGDYLSGLLSFMFDFLGHSRSKPVDVSKLDITTYTPDQEEPTRDTQWLLTHIYFLCLCHIPSMTRQWWNDCKSRTVKVTLQAWTEKYVSPPVISAALDAVASWADDQTHSEPDSPFTVRVNKRSNEITASYLVDEQTAVTRITLPAAYPLEAAAIEGIHRVAFPEAKWQAMIRTSRGAINIFNASLIDALTTFRRNIDGALKGQSECSICYSIVGSDRRLPDKRCGTCKNLFHNTCLYKWFRTSGHSLCPLCRTPFNYG